MGLKIEQLVVGMTYVGEADMVRGLAAHRTILGIDADGLVSFRNDVGQPTPRAYISHAVEHSEEFAEWAQEELMSEGLAKAIIGDNPKFVAQDDDVRFPTLVALLVIDRMKDEAESLLESGQVDAGNSLRHRLSSYEAVRLGS